MGWARGASRVFALSLIGPLPCIAQVLSEDDVRLLRVLEPAPRPESSWLDVHEKLADEVAEAQRAGVSSLCPADRAVACVCMQRIFN